jgi:hypothetical protein
VIATFSGYRLIKTFNRFVCKEFIQHAKVNSDAAGIIKWKPHSPDFYAKHNACFFNASEASGFIWRNNADIYPELTRKTA